MEKGQERRETIIVGPRKRVCTHQRELGEVQAECRNVAALLILQLENKGRIVETGIQVVIEPFRVKTVISVQQIALHKAGEWR